MLAAEGGHLLDRHAQERRHERGPPDRRDRHVDRRPRRVVRLAGRGGWSALGRRVGGGLGGRSLQRLELAPRRVEIALRHATLLARRLQLAPCVVGLLPRRGQVEAGGLALPARRLQLACERVPGLRRRGELALELGDARRERGVGRRGRRCGRGAQPLHLPAHLAFETGGAFLEAVQQLLDARRGRAEQARPHAGRDEGERFGQAQA